MQVCKRQKIATFMSHSCSVHVNAVLCAVSLHLFRIFPAKITGPNGCLGRSLSAKPLLLSALLALISPERVVCCQPSRAKMLALLFHSQVNLGLHIQTVDDYLSKFLLHIQKGLIERVLLNKQVFIGTSQFDQDKCALVLFEMRHKNTCVV